jgi:hypothetical protein
MNRPQCSHQVCWQAAVDAGDRRQVVCELVADDAPVLQRCEYCGFTDELNADGYCLLCSQTKKHQGAS